MTDGLDSDGISGYTIYRSDDPIKEAFGLSLSREPGEGFKYSTIDSQILSGIITKATGKNEMEFAKKYLFGPLGIEEILWSEDPQGNNFGGFNMNMKPNDMMKIGQLILNDGLWGETQIVSKNWIHQMTTVTSDGGAPHKEKYGLHMWIDNIPNYESFFAGGYGGQFIYIIKNLDIVVVITSENDKHREFHRYLIDHHVIPQID